MITLRILFLFAIFVISIINANIQTLNEEEQDAQNYINEIEPELIRRRNLQTEAEWNYASNITEENEKYKNKISSENAKYYKEIAEKIRKYDLRNFNDDTLKRQVRNIGKLGYAALSDAEFQELTSNIDKMESNYATVKVCSYEDRTKCDLALEPDLTEILTKSRNPEELKYYWVEFYNKAGTPVRKYFDKYVELANKAAVLNNYTSLAEMWLDEYEDNTFEKQLDQIFEDIKPLYEQIHGYVRWHLRKQYGDIISPNGPIPMHLLGNMWAQSWNEIADMFKPFPNKPSIDVTDEMIKQGYTAKKMFEAGDDFFQSMNMTKLPNTFWEKSIIEKPKDRELVCHASAWDFYKKDDVRIKQCTRVNMDQFFTVHHELGHIQYFLQYQDQPFTFREGANPGFHEAVGDVLSLSVSTPKHLEKVGLLKDYKLDNEAIINKIFFTALEKIVFIPFAYTLDKYRWGIFRGEIKPDQYNCAFWELRTKYSGIEPPVQRSEKDFDAAAKYHVSGDVEYLRYAVSHVLQFEFYKTACIKAGQYVPGDPEKILSNCDIYNSIEAGNAFKAMLQLGSSKPWPDALEVFSGERKMTVKAVMDYFEPLRVWLENENKKNNVPIGWGVSNKCQKSL